MAGMFNLERLARLAEDGEDDANYPGGGSRTTPGSQTSTVSTGDGFGTISQGEGGLIALAYGRHICIGNLAYYDHQAGPPPVAFAVYMQGEGPWQECEKAWYAFQGEEIPESMDSSTPGWHFHPGTLSTGPADTVQGIDSFIPTGITYNKTANTVVKFEEKYAAEQRPDKFRGRYKCRLVPDYDDTGTETDSGSYSANPARVAADLLINRGGLSTSRVDWPSWVAWRDYCDGSLSWDDGTTTHSIARFEAHLAFTEAIDLPDALDVCCMVSCSRWQDDGSKIRFLLPTDMTSQHTFRLDNIVADKLQIIPADIQSAPRRIVAKFLDVLDEYFLEGSAELPNDTLIGIYGDRVSLRAFPNMNHSQAQRIIAYQMRLEAENPIFIEVTAPGDSLHLLPGDFCTLELGDASLDSYYLVIDASDNSSETTPDERVFRLQQIGAAPGSGALYSDSDHHPIQRPVAP